VQFYGEENSVNSDQSPVTGKIRVPGTGFRVYGIVSKNLQGPVFCIP